MQHFGIGMMLLADDAEGLFAEVRQLDEHPERDDQTETDAHDDVDNRSARSDDARCAACRKRLQPFAEGLEHAGNRIAHFVALQEIGIARIHVGRPRLEVGGVGGQAGHEVDELVSNAENRREHDEEQNGQHHDEQGEGKNRANRSVHPVFIEPIDRPAKHEHEHGRPYDDADGNDENARHVNSNREKQDCANPRPNADKAPARLIAYARFVGIGLEGIFGISHRGLDCPSYSSAASAISSATSSLISMYSTGSSASSSASVSFAAFAASFASAAL